MLQAARKRHRSVSESASVEESSTSRERRLSGGCSTVTLPIRIPSEGNFESSMQKLRLESTSSSQYRTRAGSFGSNKLHHVRRRNDSAPSCSQRDLNKQQSRSRQNSGSKSHEMNKSQVTARERTQTSFKSEASKSVTIKAENSPTSQK